MAELRDQKAATSRVGDLDDAELLGFEWLEPERDESTQTEQAVALAFNKRGINGEGPEPMTPAR
jgi:hypothetical protein